MANSIDLMANKKVIIFSAPSGAGKGTIVGHVLSKRNDLEFSISATSRLPRNVEKPGKDYYFYDEKAFRDLISKDSFIEYEEVYPGRFYGTLKSEVERIWEKGNAIIFDVDVRGGLNLKKYFGEKALSVFIKVKSVDVLRERLMGRNTDSKEDIETRLAKAQEEMLYADKFDVILENDDLKTAFEKIDSIVERFLL